MSARLAAALIALSSSGVAAGGRDDAAEVIRWRSGAVAIEPQSTVQKRETAAALGSAAPSHALVQLVGSVSKAERRALEAAGVRLLRAVGRHSFFAALDGSRLDANAIGTMDFVAVIEPIRPDWKLHPQLARGEVATWSVVEAAKPDEDGGDTDRAAGSRSAQPMVAAYVLFHADVSLASTAEQVCRRYGARVRSQLRAVNGLVIELPFDRIVSLAAEDAVQWIEPPLPPLAEANDSVRAAVGADEVWKPPYKLTGSGVNVIVYDGGTAVAAHRDFGGRLFELDSSGASSHATHVAGTLGGDGEVSGGDYAGVAPGVAMFSYGFEQDGGLRQGFLYTDPGDLEADYTEAINEYGASIANNSIGTNIGTNGFSCEWMGDYSVTDALIDAIVRGELSNGAPFRIVWAAGNERQSTRCQDPPGSEYHSTAPPACAKNHITVGAVNSNDDSMTDFSSWGPTDDGRLKPDVCAPGCQGDDDLGVTSCHSDGKYAVACGTSSSCPVVAGIGAILLEDFRAQFPDRPDPANATLKALLAHTARDLGNKGPDYQFGYGAVQVLPAVDLLRSGSFLEREIDQDEMFTVVVNVRPDQAQLIVTLAWDDPSGVPNVDSALVNDLDLRVVDAGDNIYHPWTLDPDAPEQPAVRSGPDHLNNIEQVFVSAPPAGVYRIEVRGSSVPEGPQAFSLAATPRLLNCSSKGLVSLNRARYACEASAELELVDCDLNEDDERVEMVSVDIRSDSEPAGEKVLLLETEPDSAKFAGAIPLSTTDRTGVLKVAPGDVVRVEYQDDDDGGGNQVEETAEAEVDCQPPEVRDVRFEQIEPKSAKLVFSTGEPAAATIRLGESCGELRQTIRQRGFRSAHSVLLSGLSEAKRYFVDIEVEDEAGNAAVADNEGACFDFSTPDVVDYSTEEFLGDFDLSGQALSLTPSGGEDAFESCAIDITALPTDPRGGTELPPKDDTPTKVTLRDGATIRFDGKQYDLFFVGPNGYVTFGAGDSDNTPTLADHFDLPRVSAVFADLDPRFNGTISYKQLADLVAITWEDVPEFNTTNSNTFQIELFFDGRVRVSWLEIDATNFISGASLGDGLPDPFYESDLSDAPGCGPFPPEASSATVGASRGVPTPITLTAVDDGLPDPPGRLSYTVLSLPRFELRDAADGRVIQENDLPYTLADHGNTVVYRPPSNFGGTDSFTFVADDGGQPPEGGQSNTATITLEVGGKSLVYAFTLDRDPGWVREGGWAYGKPQGGGSYDHDPTSGFSGQNVFGYNLEGDYPNDLSDPEYLTTFAIDCSEMKQTELRFRRWLGIESSTWDQAVVQVSNNAREWETVWQNSSGVSDDEWTPVTYDIAAVADGRTRVYVRWGLGPTDFAVSYPGWNIDDIEIWAVAEETLGDMNCDGSIDFNDIDPFVVALASRNEYQKRFPDCNYFLGDLNGDGLVDFADIDLFVELLTG